MWVILRVELYQQPELQVVWYSTQYWPWTFNIPNPSKSQIYCLAYLNIVVLLELFVRVKIKHVYK